MNDLPTLRHFYNLGIEAFHARETISTHQESNVTNIDEEVSQNVPNIENERSPNCNYRSTRGRYNYQSDRGRVWHNTNTGRRYTSSTMSQGRGQQQRGGIEHNQAIKSKNFYRSGTATNNKKEGNHQHNQKQPDGVEVKVETEEQVQPANSPLNSRDPTQSLEPDSIAGNNRTSFRILPTANAVNFSQPPSLEFSSLSIQPTVPVSLTPTEATDPNTVRQNPIIYNQQWGIGAGPVQNFMYYPQYQQPSTLYNPNYYSNYYHGYPQ